MARTLGFEIAKLEIRRGEDIGPRSRRSRAARTHFMSAATPLVNTNRLRINSLALAARLPTMHGVQEFVEAGGLMSYGPKLPGPVPARRRVCRQDFARHEAGRHPSRATDQVRAGINLKTAKALGLEFRPPCSPAPTR